MQHKSKSYAFLWKRYNPHALTLHHPQAWGMYYPMYYPITGIARTDTYLLNAATPEHVSETKLLDLQTSRQQVRQQSQTLLLEAKRCGSTTSCGFPGSSLRRHVPQTPTHLTDTLKY